MSGVKRKKDIIDEILDPGDNQLGLWLAIAVIVAIGLFVFFG